MTVDEIMYTVDSYADGEMREGYYGGLRSMIEAGIKAAIQEAVLAEREACIKCALRAKPASDSPYALKTMIVDALEARGQK